MLDRFLNTIAPVGAVQIPIFARIVDSIRRIGNDELKPFSRLEQPLKTTSLAAVSA